MGIFGLRRFVRPRFPFDFMSTKPQRWIIQFTATRGDQTARVKMGAFGETLAHAIAFVIEHCKGQYDSMTDFAEWPNVQAQTRRE